MSNNDPIESVPTLDVVVEAEGYGHSYGPIVFGVEPKPIVIDVTSYSHMPLVSCPDIFVEPYEKDTGKNTALRHVKRDWELRNRRSRRK